MTATTLDGVLLKGVAGSRPAASAVAKGTIYSATDTGAITQSDGVSTWSTFATTGAGATITTKDEGSTLSSTVTTLDFVGAGVTASGSGATTTVTIAGGGGGSSDVGDKLYLYANFR